MSPPSVAVLLGSTVQGRFLVNQPPVSACPRTHDSPGFPFTFCALKPKPTSGTPHRAHVCAKSRRAQAQGCADLPVRQGGLRPESSGWWQGPPGLPLVRRQMVLPTNNRGIAPVPSCDRTSRFLQQRPCKTDSQTLAAPGVLFTFTELT